MDCSISTLTNNKGHKDCGKLSLTSIRFSGFTEGVIYVIWPEFGGNSRSTGDGISPVLPGNHYLISSVCLNGFWQPESEHDWTTNWDLTQPPGPTEVRSKMGGTV